ncbi:hypothetical protein [Amycolatopsis sp. CA-230715]|uniref:hypothetical protein n=1 Tax=Amycolatopsis sp. CA-230715 TaxID=2745196 RepID=UPI001C0115EB|nr:hypothetical protein [Amycolatopsis sp. CA-230715]QWF85733.1 hypothetical protein HUW46_09213 [Amycolatopsis sp. CA-230715]
MTEHQHQSDNPDESIDELRIAAKVAVADLRHKENLACYWSGLNNTRQDADEAYSATLDAIDSLSDATQRETVKADTVSERAHGITTGVRLRGTGKFAELPDDTAAEGEFTVLYDDHVGLGGAGPMIRDDNGRHVYLDPAKPITTTRSAHTPNTPGQPVASRSGQHPSGMRRGDESDATPQVTPPVDDKGCKSLFGWVLPEHIIVSEISPGPHQAWCVKHERPIGSVNFKIFPDVYFDNFLKEHAHGYVIVRPGDSDDYKQALEQLVQLVPELDTGVLSIERAKMLWNKGAYLMKVGERHLRTLGDSIDAATGYDDDSDDDVTDDEDL